MDAVVSMGRNAMDLAEREHILWVAGHAARDESRVVPKAQDSAARGDHRARSRVPQLTPREPDFRGRGCVYYGTTPTEAQLRREVKSSLRGCNSPRRLLSFLSRRSERVHLRDAKWP